MSLRSKLWVLLAEAYPTWLRKVYKMDIGKGVRIARGAHLDKSINPKGVHIGDGAWVLNGAFVMAHDHCRSLRADTYIGKNSIIGVNAIIMPGVHIGEETVIGSGAVVTKDVPAHCIAAGNPAKVIKTDINVSNGKILSCTQTD